MWKKLLLASAGLLLVGLLIAGAVTAVKADNGNQAVRGPFGGKVIDRAAQILGIDKQKLIDAFKQAGTEVARQNMDDRFATWVKEGKLTQAQADEYKAWLAARPAGVPALVHVDAAKASEFLDKLLKDGKITQDQYNAAKDWLAKKPAFNLPAPDRPAGVPAGKCRGWKK